MSEYGEGVMLHHSERGNSLWDRRQFLIAAGGALLAASPLGLIGCGGVGGGLGGGHAVQVSVIVVLPTGSSLVITDLTILGGLAEVPIPPTGTVITHVPGGVPSLTTVADASGNAIYLGFVDPSTSPNTIDATSTAVALLYFLICGPSVPAESKQSILVAIAASSAIPPLAAVIAARVAIDPHAIANQDPQIASALQTAYSAIGGGSQGGQPSPAPYSTLPDLLVQPTGIQSGFELLQEDSSVSVRGVNHFRRRCQLGVYRVSETSNDGTVTRYPQAVPVGKSIPVDGTTALGLFSTIENLLSGQTAFVPVTTPQIPLGLQPSTSRTDFEVIVLGANTSITEPAFYSELKYAAQVDDWRATVDNLNLTEAFFDIALGFILEMWGIRTLFKTDSMVVAFVKGITAIEDVTLQTLITRAKQGAYSEAVSGLIQLTATSDIVSKNVRATLRPYVALLQQEAIDRAGQNLAEKTMKAALAQVAAAFGVVEVALYVGDLAAIAHDVANSNQGDRWTATVIKPALIIDPKTTTMVPGTRKTFTVSLPAGTPGTIVYDWTQTGHFATLSSSDGIVGPSIETSSTSVDLITTGSDSGTITVTVVAYRVGTGGVKTEIGRTTATVTLSAVSSGSDFRLLTPYLTIDNGGAPYHQVIGWGFFTFPVAPVATTYTITYLQLNGDGSTTRRDLGSVTHAQLQSSIPVVTVEALQNNTATRYAASFYNMGNGVVGFFYRQATDTDTPFVFRTEADLDASVNSQIDGSWERDQLELRRD